MFRRISLACAVLAGGAGLAACSSGSSSSSSTSTTTKTPVTLAGTLDCAKFSTAANKVTAIASQGASAQASVASELAIIEKLDAASGKAIGLLQPIAPDLVKSWNAETAKSLASLRASAAKGDSATAFSKVLQATNSGTYKSVSQQLGTIVRAKCPQIYTTTTTTTTPAG